MSKLLRSGQIFYSWLLGVDFPGVQVKDGRAPLIVDFAHAETRVGVGKQPEITAAAKREPPPVHLQHAHWKFVQLVCDFVGSKWSVGDAVIRVKTYREN